uniref:C2 domain-containing protein n=1 Tax=Globodera pallida TaxID=36090 RepID=A0A183C2I1_GLOPA
MNVNVNVNIQKPVTKFNSWARGQLSKAAGYIRQVSRDLVDPDGDDLEAFPSGPDGSAEAVKIRERRTKVQNSDGQFFERLCEEECEQLIGILPSRYLKTEHNANSNGIVPRKNPKMLSERFAQFSLKNSVERQKQKPEEQKKQIKDLYLETLYTILHKIGKEAVASEEQLAQYAKSAFQVDERTHLTLLEKARREKPPILLLNVLLLEARDLIAKDIDGFSDPLVMLGLVPSGRQRSPATEGICIEPQSPTSVTDLPETESSTSAEGGGNSARKNPLLQRFSGSFRRKARKARELASDTEEGIPARIIKASSVQRKTLNPKWNEKFQFVVGDVTDRFHLDIWDHDDENRSVLDVVTSLNQVQGLKGLGRYFKEVTQSARSSSGDLVDDFLGSVTLYIKDIPSAGLEQWFKLEQRSTKSEVSGQIHLKLWLSTREEHRLSSTDEQRNDDFIFLEENELVDVQQHKDLLKQFALYEISKRAEPVCAFRGQLPELALLILHQHAIQSDLTELHQLVCQWLAYLQMIEMGISFELLLSDEEYVLADSLLQFIEHCRTTILNHRLQLRMRRAGSSRRRSPSPKRSDLEAFSEMLRCFKFVRESAIGVLLVPLPKKNVAEDLRELLMHSALLHFDAINANIAQRQKLNFDALHALALLVQALNTTMARCAKFEPIFRQCISECDYADIAYGQFDTMLHEHIISKMMDEQRGALRMIMQICHTDAGQSDDVQLTNVLQVHMALNEFGTFRNGTTRRRTKMDQLDWTEHFDKAIQRWLELALVKAFARVDLSLNLDVQMPIIVNNDVRQTVSGLDTCHIMEQLLFVWERLTVSSVLLRAELTVRLVRLLCKIGKHFADQLMMRRPFENVGVSAKIPQQQHQQVQTAPTSASDRLSPEQIDQFASMINSCEQVRRILACTDRLRLDELAALYERKTKDKEFRSHVERPLDACSHNIVEQIELLIGQFVRRQIGPYKKAIFHLVWSPSACPTEECLKPLIKLLDGELSLVHRCLLHRNFTRVMYAQMQLLLKLFEECVSENIGLEPSFYRRLTDSLAILLDFFHAEGKGIAVDAFTASNEYKRFHEQISLYQMPTDRLIEHYYAQLLRAQDEVNECKYGILNLRAYYNPHSELLVVDVLSAKQIIPLDSNGLSDPFVVLELLPRIHFPDQPRLKTKVVTANLNPVFGETFEFHIPPYLPQSALVHFVIMDHDFLKANDFAGEAFLDLSEVPGFAQGGVGSSLKQFNLVLTHPSAQPSNKSIIVVLASRKDDKDAEEFMRNLSITY